MDYLEFQKQQDPKRAQKMQQIENHTSAVLNSLNPAAGLVTIPVVIHVVYRTSTENISDEQIQTQLDVLNDDFRRLNSDQTNQWPQAADAEVEFCLASVDPDGNATSGITRTSTTVNGFGTNDAVKFTSSGGIDAWPAADYLNIWVCNIGGGILGYAQFPGGNPATDGVVNGYQYFGTTGTATAPFNLGRTMTHEVGHYLNLRHIWGDGNCNADDFVSDTPNSDAPNYGCASSHSSCSSLDMVQNYMDYSDDACMNLFTQGQADRMAALFNPGGARFSLTTSTACGTPPTATCTDGIQNGDETGVDCGGSCPNSCSTGCSQTVVSISITFDNYPEETSWSVTDANGATVASGGTYPSSPDGSTFSEDLCLGDGCYDFQINDTYGDGICCSYGNGSYTVTSDGSVVASGGAFASSETTNFCIGGGTAPTCTDGVQNGDETGVDCGGSCPTACATCTDGIQNGDETGVDCGGSCPTACATCTDGVQNGDETGVDCGGSCPTACATCTDGVQNGNETGVDCGGSCPTACATCTDGIQNGDETGIDCGGSCPNSCSTGCSQTVVNISITFDNYPEETSWSVTDANGATVASGGTYGSSPDGSTFSENLCLGDGCYDFQINDAFGDGICCSYGSGSYTVISEGSVVASGGAFASSETTNFCIGGSTAPTCTDGIQNGDETGVDCGGSCPNSCGGSGSCSNVTINSNDFEGGWGIWNDGGSDARRSVQDANYASSGNYCVRLRDNTSTSVMTTDNLNLSSYEEITVDFAFYARSMESNEDFWLQISNNGGSSYTTVASYARGVHFDNDVFYSDAVTISGPFASNSRVRFRCDASGNSDWVYIDDVTITGCTNNARLIEENAEAVATTPTANTTRESLLGQELISNFKLYPNPTSDNLTIAYDMAKANDVELIITDFTGKILKVQELDEVVGSAQLSYDAGRLAPGFYFVHLVTEGKRYTEKFVVVR